ncbi:OadG family transporter subunit [Ferrimonas gelatinilytica]|uniref:OadG family transporter subunit n=1 Tax=Ferrimonas gelatinilytica TaxID=1255257 RepID=UPI0031EE39AC
MDTLLPQLLTAASVMLTGMVLVFLFLSLLVLGLKLLAHFCAPPKEARTGSLPAPPPGHLSRRHLAAITAAIHQHRANEGNSK